MKHTILALIMLTAVPMLGMAQNVLRLENNTDNDVNAAYAYYNPSQKCWVSVGWYIVPRHNSKRIDLGNYVGQLFVHGKSQSLTTKREWGDGDMLCVDEKDAFEIVCPRAVQCRVQKMFSKIDFPNGGNSFIFNP